MKRVFRMTTGLGLLRSVACVMPRMTAARSRTVAVRRGRPKPVVRGLSPAAMATKRARHAEARVHHLFMQTGPT